MIVGINLNSIKAEVNREKIPDGNINIGSTPKIESIVKKDFDVLGLKGVLFVGFTFETKYEPGLGSIVMKGEVIYQGKDTDKLVKRWEKEKKVDDVVSAEILNAIFRRCLSKSIDLSAELNMPPPIAFPVVRPKDSKEEYIG